MQGAEIELKAALPPAELARIARAHSRRSKPHASTFLVTRYFDTRDEVLASAGIALRLRSSPGSSVIQSVKAGRRALGGFHSSQEWETQLPGPRPELDAIPDRSVARRIRELVAGQRLVPLFETRVRRRLYLVSVSGGVVEIALDRGQIRAGRAREAISEVEFELKSGSPEILFLLAERWIGRTAARLVLPNKAERGRALARGAPLRPAILSSKPPEARMRVPAGERFDQLLARLAEAVAANLFATLTSDDPEGPHQLRVTLRRFRTALRLHRSILDRGLAGELARTARDVGRIVSPLRDADVVAGGLLIPRADPALAAALARWREETRSMVRRELLEEGATAFAIRLLALAALGGWQRAGRRHRLLMAHEEVVRPALERLWHRCEDAGDRLAGLSPEARHQFRKDLKKLRYAVEMMPVDLQSKPFVSGVKRLLEDLGELNDLTVLEGFAPHLAREETAALQRLVASLRHAGTARSDQLLGRACRHWQALAATPLIQEPAEPRDRSPSELEERSR